MYVPFFVTKTGNKSQNWMTLWRVSHPPLPGKKIGEERRLANE